MPKNSQKNSPKSQRNFNGQTLNMTQEPNQSMQVENQNQTHNTKKEAQGPNTKR
ncbi:hypothetical protein V6615_05945 [Oscillospiraceae bacterium PP1C4]